MRDHPLRDALHREVHARPYERLTAPLVLARHALVGAAAEAARAHLRARLAEHGVAAPADDGNHLSVDLGGVWLRWERHTEFLTLTFWRSTDAPSFDDDLGGVPARWLADAPGERLVALRLVVLPDASGAGAAALQTLVRDALDDESLVGSRVMDAQAQLYSDLLLDADGAERWIVGVDAMTPRRLGRAVQRLLDIETYRLMALLGLPAAREVGAALADAERELAAVADEIRRADAAQEPELLRRLTQLAAQVEGLYARTHARFSASAAYFELVDKRIGELREERIAGLQTLGEFMDRRLGPAMQTCAWAARRQQALSERASRVSDLLRTRVEIEQQASSQALLDAMNRRQQAQLLLQSAVEGLSVAAITYYGAGLVGYFSKGLKSLGVPLDPDAAVALAIPLIAIGVWLGLRRLHARILAAALR
jgi:uncharacterized membrane-anchored protein